MLLDHSKIALVAMICNPSGLDKQVEWENHRYNKLTTTTFPAFSSKFLVTEARLNLNKGNFRGDIATPTGDVRARTRLSVLSFKMTTPPSVTYGQLASS